VARTIAFSHAIEIAAPGDTVFTSLADMCRLRPRWWTAAELRRVKDSPLGFKASEALPTRARSWRTQPRRTKSG